MFFVLAKVLWALLQPSSLMIGAVILGSALMATKWRRLARGLLWGGIAALLVGGLSPMGDIMIRPLEQRFEAADLERAGPPVAGIIVLGGGADLQARGTRQIAGLNEAAERYTEAVALARRLPGARLVFSGGAGGLLRVEPPEAETAGRLFEALGVAKERVTLEAASRDTWENALFTARLVQPRPGERWLLVTSAGHMPRAMGAFRQAGFAVEPWPVDYRTADAWDLVRPFEAPSEGLKRLDQVTREWVGLLAYWLTRRSDELFPGPR